MWHTSINNMCTHHTAFYRIKCATHFRNHTTINHTCFDQLIDFMLLHPILINRPFVVTPLGTRLCRPSEAVLDILAQPQQGAFSKEDGEAVIDANGQRLPPQTP